MGIEGFLKVAKVTDFISWYEVFINETGIILLRRCYLK